MASMTGFVQRNFFVGDKKEKGVHEDGLTETEAIGRAFGKENLERGLARGDVWQDKDGYYIFKRKVKSHLQSKIDQTKLGSDSKINSGEDSS